MSEKIDFKVIEGHRDELECEIPHALFTIYDEKKLKKKLAEIHSKLAPKGKVTLISSNTQKIC